MPITALAPELLSQCLWHLPRNDLMQASLTCRAWLAPSRDHYWSGLRMNIDDECAERLAPVLGEGSTVPAKIDSLRIDESDDMAERDEHETAAWQNNFPKIMQHFSNVSVLTIGCLDASRFPQEKRREILRSGQATNALIVQWLKVEHAQEAASFVLNQPNIRFLGLGPIVLAKKETEETDAAAETEQSSDSTAISTTTDSLPECDIQLQNVRHLCIFAGRNGLAWSHIVPLLAKGVLSELKTLVANCSDRDAYMKLIDATAPALHAFGVSYYVPGVDIDLRKATSLKMLSIDLCLYPGKDYILADAATTLGTSADSIEHVFFNIGPKTFSKEDEKEGAAAQWETIDTLLAAKPLLKQITVTLVIESSIAVFIGMRGGIGDLVETWTTEALEQMKTQLPMCSAKDLLEVKKVFSGWSGSAFAGYPIPE